MLKKNLISQAKSLIPAVLIAGFGVLSSHQAANAAILNLVNITSNPLTSNQDIYNYNLFIPSGEGVSVLDRVDIGNVTAGDFFTGPTGWSGSKTGNEVSFVYIDGGTFSPIIGGANGTTISGFQLLGNVGSVTNNGSYQFVNTTVFNPTLPLSGNGTVFVPGTIMAVPESSNVLGILLVGGIAAASGLRKQLVKS